MEEFLENTPSIPSSYIKYISDFDTAVTDNPNSLFYETDVLSLDWDTEIYLPGVADNNTISPHENAGKMTGFFDINGNGTATVVIYYYNISNARWYRRTINIVGVDLEYHIDDIINADINTSLYLTTRIYSVAGRLLTKSGGQFSINNGTTWTNSFVNYVPNMTLYRKSVTTGSSYGVVTGYNVLVGDRSHVARVLTRLPNHPVFSLGSYEIDINEGSGVVTTIFPTVSHEGTIEMSLSGDDADLFDIDDSGIITVINDLDYEDPQDLGTDNVYSLSVVADNGTYTSSVPVSITVLDVNEIPPLFDDPGLLVIAENIIGSWVIGTTQGAIPITYSILNTLDRSFFTFTPSTRTLTLNSGLNYENKSDINHDGIYEVDLVAENQYGTDTLRVRVLVTNVIEDITPNQVSYGTYNDVTRNDIFYVTALISGVETDAVLNVANGELSNDNGVSRGSSVLYVPNLTKVRRSVTASGLYETTSTFSSIVNGITITATVRTGNTPVSMQSAINVSVNEGVLTAFASAAKTAGYGVVQYEIVNGVDSSFINVDSNGYLYFKSPTNYYSPNDADNNNVYTFRVRGYNSFSEAFTDVSVTILNVILPVRLPTSQYFKFTDTALIVGTILPLVTDDITQYAIEGVDSGLFSINSNTGLISFIEQATFDNPIDSGNDNKYLFKVVYSNALYSSVCSVRVDIVSSATVVLNIDENVTVGAGGGALVGGKGIYSGITSSTF